VAVIVQPVSPSGIDRGLPEQPLPDAEHQRVDGQPVVDEVVFDQCLR
jgi:hypothetical protein